MLDGIQLDVGVYLTTEYPMLSASEFQLWFNIDNKLNYGICNSYHQIIETYKPLIDNDLYVVILTKCDLIEFGTDWGEILALNNDEVFHYHIFKQLPIVSQ